MAIRKYEAGHLYFKGRDNRNSPSPATPTPARSCLPQPRSAASHLPVIGRRTAEVITVCNRFTYLRRYPLQVGEDGEDTSVGVRVSG